MAGSPGPFRNALAESRSPYLLQHASNPVDWMEWGEKAFAEARRRDVPIFLSIGYSTCHWCHVMAHESFENEAIAAAMNLNFVNIKLDREERPDVDRIYMAFVQSTTGSGGWPMSVWLTPELKPFYGGTYFPPEDRYGRIGFTKLIRRIADLWRDDRSSLNGYGDKSQELLDQSAQLDLRASEASVLAAAGLGIEQLLGEYDVEFGGFGGAPKFPMPAYYELLLQAMEMAPFAAKRVEIASAISHSLDAMAAGGIWDHLGAGFHRYSVDQYWHVPHYEKMLYDQGQLARVYAEAFRVTGNARFLDVANSIVAYIGRDLLGPQGQLFAAEDADSELLDGSGGHGEGVFYTWRKSEIDTVLAVTSPLFCAAYDVRPDGNARPESDPHHELTGLNTLTRVKDDAELAAKFGLSSVDVAASLAASRTLLFGQRAKRPRPHLDDKAIVAWNAIAISGACATYQASGNEGALKLALGAGTFLREVMWQSDEHAFRRVYREGLGSASGFAEDYAWAANACVDLYESTFDPEWIAFGAEVVEQLLVRFEDVDRGGFFATEAGDASLIARMREDYDGAEPAASSIAVFALQRLGTVLDDASLVAKAITTVRSFAVQWARAPRALPLMLAGACRLESPDQQIVIVGPAEDPQTKELINAAYRWRLRNSCVIRIDPSTSLGILARNQKLAAMEPLGGRPTVYLCENYACKAPETDVGPFEKSLRAARL